MERYKRLRNKEEYFSDWDEETMGELTEELQEQIYCRYRVKYEVFNRDNFTCVNQNCHKNKSPITLHHIKFQKNGGMDKARNCVTLCNACHKGFHRAKIPITFNGMTYQVHKEDRINWKAICREGKKIRKNNKEFYNYEISWKLLVLLMQFLERDYMNVHMDD